jgi:hypothetical protein
VTDEANADPYLSKYSQPAVGLGHNTPSIDAVVEENLRRGLYLTHLLALHRIIKDPRAEQRHRLVLVALSECTNSSSALAYPGRAWLAANIVYYVNGEARQYSEGTIANTLSELAELGYLRMRRQAPENGSRRALAHYAVTSPSVEDLQALIAEACAAIRAGPKRPFPVGKRADVTANLDVKTRVGSDVKTSGGQELVRETGSKFMPQPLRGAACGPKPAAVKSGRLGTRLPEDWTLPPDWLDWVKLRFVATDCQIATEAEKFRDYWHAKAGRDATKVDWPATWRTWWNNGFHKIPRRAAPGAVRSDARRIIDTITGGR